LLSLQLFQLALMGLLRFYLAICVIAQHCGGPFLPWQMQDGTQAVRIFYIISGFYMAMVLSTRYSKPGRFYLSRFLRIFPTYWIVLGATVVVSLVGGLFYNRWMLLRPYVNHPFSHNGTFGFILAAVLNFTLIGQDWIMFLKHDAGQSIQFATTIQNDPSPLYWYLLIPQAWTIGVELAFYAIAPYLNRLSTKWLGAVTLAAFAARLISSQYLGLDRPPWNNRFFPLELGLFLFGMLAYRLYARFGSHPAFQRCQSTTWRSYVPLSIAILIMMSAHIHAAQLLGHFLSPPISGLLTYPPFTLVIPVLFLISKNNKFDRFIGEMSYPVYLMHFLILVAVANTFSIAPGAELGRIASLLSVAFSMLLYIAFIAPLDRKRHKFTIKDRQNSQ